MIPDGLPLATRRRWSTSTRRAVNSSGVNVSLWLGIVAPRWLVEVRSVGPRARGTPVPGGFQSDEVLYLLRKIIESGKKLIGFDLVEVGVGETNYDAVVASRLLWKICNLFVKSNCTNESN